MCRLLARMQLHPEQELDRDIQVQGADANRGAAGRCHRALVIGLQIPDLDLGLDPAERQLERCAPPGGILGPGLVVGKVLQHRTTGPREQLESG